MALRPLAFGMRLRDKDRGRTLRVQNDPANPRVFIVEDVREDDETRIRFHSALPDAIRDAASTWRRRLH
jgi:hypothetical protein